MLPQIIISIIAVAAVVAISAYGFTTRGYFVHLALVSAPFFIYLAGRLDVWLAIIIGIAHGKLIFPGLPQGLLVIHVLMAGYVAVHFARCGIVKKPLFSLTASNLLLIAFLAVIGFTAYMRGFGLRALGDTMWGGMSYIKLILTSLFFLAAQSISLSEKLLRRAIYCMLAFSLLPAFAQILFLASRGEIHQQYLFVEAYVGGLWESLAALDLGGAVRFHMLGGLSMTLLMIAVILLDQKTPASRTLFFLLVLSSLATAALSGFRARVLSILIMSALFYLYEHGKVHWHRLWSLVAMGCLSLVAIYGMAPYLPSAIQRAFSWLPNIDIPPLIKLEASLSTQNRLRVWELAWNEVPRYLLIGKGFAINPSDIISPTVRQDWVLYSFLSHNYHSGPLSLLLDTGAFGFVLGTFFLLATCTEMIRRRSDVALAPLLRRAFMFFLVQHLFNVIAFYLIFGDVRETFPDILLNLSIMHATLNASSSSLPRASLPSDPTARRISLT